MVFSYAFASLRTGWPGIGMLPTCSIPKDAYSIPGKGSVLERSYGGCSDPSLVCSSSGVAFASLVPSMWKRVSLRSVAHATRRSKILPFGLVRLHYNLERRRGSHACVGAVEIGGAQTIQEQKVEVKKGSRVKVKGPLKVYHIPKVPEFDLDGLEGEVKDVLSEWKGKPISANLPYKVQFFTQIDGREVKFVAHLKDGEIEVVE